MKIRIHADARDEIAAAQAYLNAQSPGLGRRFIADLTETLLAVEQRPQSFPRVETAGEADEFRRARLRIFQYLVVFELIGKMIVILAIAHTCRAPNYWLHRRRS